MVIEVLLGWSLLDAAIASAGSLEDLFALAELNNISITDTLTPGTVLQTTGLTYPASSVPNNDQLTVLAVEVLQRQTMADMAIQQAGSLEGLFALAQLNGLSITDDLQAGQALNYSLTPISKQVVKLYQDNGYRPASAIDEVTQVVLTGPEGIDYWAIEFDFIVS